MIGSGRRETIDAPIPSGGGAGGVVRPNVRLASAEPAKTERFMYFTTSLVPTTSKSGRQPWQESARHPCRPDGPA